MTASSSSALLYHPTPKAKKGENLPDGTIKHPPRFTFRGGNQNIVLDKADALACQRFLGREDAEEKIADFLKRPVSGPWIAEEAAEAKLTLVEVINQVVNYNYKERPRSAAPAEGMERLMSIMAKMAPKEGGRQVLDRLKTLIELHGEGAVVDFDKRAARPETDEFKGGRDDQGFVYIRKQKKVA